METSLRLSNFLPAFDTKRTFKQLPISDYMLRGNEVLWRHVGTMSSPQRDALPMTFTDPPLCRRLVSPVPLSLFGSAHLMDGSGARAPVRFSRAHSFCVTVSHESGSLFTANISILLCLMSPHMSMYSTWRWRLIWPANDPDTVFTER